MARDLVFHTSVDFTSPTFFGNIIFQMLEAGADPNLEDYNGVTCYQLVPQLDHFIERFKFLVKLQPRTDTLPSTDTTISKLLASFEVPVENPLGTKIPSFFSARRQWASAAASTL